MSWFEHIALKIELWYNSLHDCILLCEEIIPRFWKISLWFVSFESVYWFFGNDALRMIRNLLKHSIVMVDFTDPLSVIIWDFLSVPALIFSIFSLAMCFKNILIGVGEAIAEEVSELVRK